MKYWNHFKCDMDNLGNVFPVLPSEYDFIYYETEDVPEKYKAKWEFLVKRKWKIKKGFMLFVNYNGEIIATSFFAINEGIGEPNVAFCKEEHRNKGIYKYLMLKTFEIIKERGVETIIAVTSKKYLWPFYESLGFVRGEKVK